MYDETALALVVVWQCGHWEAGIGVILNTQIPYYGCYQDMLFSVARALITASLLPIPVIGGVH